MFGLSRLVDLAGTLGFQIKDLSKKENQKQRPIRRTRLNVEELEGRVVPTLLGQSLFPADNPWNQNIASAPVAINSAAVISHIGSAVRVHPDWGNASASNGSSPLYGIPFNVVHGNAPGATKINVVIDKYPDETDFAAVPIPADAVLEGDYQNGPNLNGGGYGDNQRGDSHLLLWDQDNNIAYEFFGVTRPADPTLFPDDNGIDQAHADGRWHAAQETVWNMNTNTFRSLGNTSADAAGLSILAGLARPDEGLPTSQGGQGVINHALRFTLPDYDVAPQYVYPASHMVSVSAGTTNLPLGSRLRLMNTPAVNAVIAGLGPQAQVIAHAMQQYGLILADIGSSMFVSGASATVNTNNIINFTWNMDDVLSLSSLNAGFFQVVDLTPQVTGLSATGAAAGSTITVMGKNFTGSAGHLSVLFGATASPSVTVVDDSHLSVVVPAGAGTVNVRVQSGVNESDPNGIAHNVENSIFGYGISAINAADQFTYGAQPAIRTVSAAGSVAGFAAASVVAGSTDAVTLSIKDSTGNVMSGLSNAAFSFALAGGTSTGTFGVVTETPTRGTYQLTFTAASVGTTTSLNVVVNGVALDSKPVITVTGRVPSVLLSSVRFATASVASGAPDAVTIVVKDANGLPIAGLASGVFQLSLSGGGSTGTFSSVTQTSTPGTYSAIFTGKIAGSASSLTASVSAVALATSPMIVVNPGAVSASMSQLLVATPTVAVGGTDMVTIMLRDAVGNAISGLPASAFQFTFSGNVWRGTLSSVTETALKGTYKATFTATHIGRPRYLSVWVNGLRLSMQPTLQVVAAPVAIGGAV